MAGERQSVQGALILHQHLVRGTGHERSCAIYRHKQFRVIASCNGADSEADPCQMTRLATQRI
jgi:hypothetical protein